jgi:hypothetical protein
MWLARRVAPAGVQEARRPEGANKFGLQEIFNSSCRFTASENRGYLDNQILVLTWR